MAGGGDPLDGDAGLWVEEGHSHVHCAAAGCACRYDHSPLYVHEAAFNSAVSENWLCGDEVKMERRDEHLKLEWSSVLCRSGADLMFRRLPDTRSSCTLFIH